MSIIDIRSQEIKPCPWCGQPPRFRFGKVACVNTECTVRPKTVAWYVAGHEITAIEDWNERRQDVELNQLRTDAMTLALRLMGESESSFAPETHEVMTRWRVKCLKLIGEIERGSTP